MFGLDLILFGFFVTLGGKGAIDTYDGTKEVLTGALSSETVHDAVDKVKSAGASISNTVTEGAKNAKKVVVDGVEKTHETIDNTLKIHKDEHRVGADGDKIKTEASAA